MMAAGVADWDTDGHNVNSKTGIPEKNIFLFRTAPLKT